MIAKTIYNVLESSWPMLAIFLVIIITVRIADIKMNDKEFVLYKELLGLFFIIYILLLFELVTNTETAGGTSNFIPFKEILRYSLSSKLFIYNVLGNIILFIPFGYFISSYINAKKTSSILLISFITSLTIELVQLRIGRVFDIDDIILNVVGGLLGFMLYIALSAIKKHLPSIFQKNFIYNIIFITLIVLLISYFIKTVGLGWF